MQIPFVDYALYSAVLENENTPSSSPETITAKSVILTHSRSSVIVSNFVGKTISVYNGKTSKRLLIKSSMIGYSLGKFILTKKLGSSIHNSERNRKKKEKMRRKITQKKVRKTAVKPVVKKK